MTKYRIYGTTTVSVIKEVWANSEDEAYDKAYSELDCLTAYCGNGGTDCLIGVEGEGESVSADDSITYDDCEVIEDDPDYFECPECGAKCKEKDDHWYCSECYKHFTNDGDEVDFLDDVEDDEG